MTWKCFQHHWPFLSGIQRSLVVFRHKVPVHYNDVMVSSMASQITSIAIVYSTVYSGADQRKLQSSASLAFVRGIHRWPVNSPHKGSITGKMFPFDDVIMSWDFFNASEATLTNINLIIYMNPSIAQIRAKRHKAQQNRVHILWEVLCGPTETPIGLAICIQCCWKLIL